MALLSIEKRKKWFLYLGLGAYNRTNIKKLQKRYFVRSKDIDGVYGEDTDRLLRHLHHVKKYMPNFTPEEFRCGCKGKYCTGYPTWLRVNECKNIQAIRKKYGKPLNVTSGLRCVKFNNMLNGSSKTSRHMTGRAVDFYISGVTNTLSGRKKVIKYARKLANHNYSYCDGYNSNGNTKLSAPNMGTCIHTDVK